jgi:hypothetical protein
MLNIYYYVGDKEAARFSLSIHAIDKPATAESGASYRKPGEKSGVTVMYFALATKSLLLANPYLALPMQGRCDIVMSVGEPYRPIFPSRTHGGRTLAKELMVILGSRKFLMRKERVYRAAVSTMLSTPRTRWRTRFTWTDQPLFDL